MRPAQRLFLFGIVLSLLSQLVAAGAGAQTDEIDQLRADRDEVRAERARAAADLDPLFAANEQIEEALSTLTEDLASREASLAATQARLDKARNDIEVAELQVALEDQRIAELELQLQQQAISAYVQPRTDGVGSDVLGSADLNDGERRRAFVLAVSTSRNDILDELRTAQDNKERLVALAEAAERDIAVQEQQAVLLLQQVNDAIADQQRLRQILDARIADFQAEVDAHAADEDLITSQLTGLIAEEEARQAAIREAARIQAERERVAREEARLAQERAEALAAGQVPADTAVNRTDAALSSAPPSAAPGSLIWPVQGVVTSGFGPRWGRMHNGLDIAANTGTNVVAAAGGRVIAAGPNGGFGNLVLIDHGGGLVTAYAHLNVINVSNGQSISTGAPVGTVGCTGSCTGPHLHFETRVGGVAYDPRAYLS